MFNGRQCQAPFTANDGILTHGKSQTKIEIGNCKIEIVLNIAGNIENIGWLFFQAFCSAPVEFNKLLLGVFINAPGRAIHVVLLESDYCIC